MAVSSNDLENMESFEFNLKLDRCYVEKMYPVEVKYAGQPVNWNFNIKQTHESFIIQFDLLLHEELVFASEKPLKVKKFSISSNDQGDKKVEYTEIKYTYSDGVFRFEPLCDLSPDDDDFEKYVHFSFLLDKSGFLSARNSILTPFPDYTYKISWFLKEAFLHQKFIILDSNNIEFKYRLKPIRWQLKLCSFWMCDQHMLRFILQTPDNISFHRDDPILKSNIQFFRGKQCLIITTNDSYSWDGSVCSFVTPYKISKLLNPGLGRLRVLFEFTVGNSVPENIELPSCSTELASCSSIAEIPSIANNEEKMMRELADLRRKSTLFSEYNYVLKWDSHALPKESSPVQVTYRQTHITWNMKLINCTKIDKKFVKFALHTSNKIRCHLKDPSLIIMRDGFLLVSKMNDLYTWNNGTFEFQSTYDTSEWRKTGGYKIRFEFTLENSEQHNFESAFPSVPASSNCSSDSFEVITQEQCSEDGSVGSIEVIPTEIEAAPLASFTNELLPNSSSSTSMDQVKSNDNIDIAVSGMPDEMKSIDDCSEDDSTITIDTIPADEENEPISTSSPEVPLPDSKDDCLSDIKDEKPVAVNEHKDMRLVEDFQRLFDTSLNYDTVINLVFKVHRSILAIRSPEFDRMIKEEQTNKAGILKLTIADTSYDEMSALLQYIYTGTLSTDRCCLKMIEVAERFGVIGLRVLCEDIICSEISATNFVDKIHLINECKSEKVHECLLTFMQKNISILVNCTKFRQFMTSNPELMFKLLSRIVKPNL